MEEIIPIRMGLFKGKINYLRIEFSGNLIRYKTTA